MDPTILAHDMSIMEWLQCLLTIDKPWGGDGCKLVI
jgi:hypothetical protein